MKHLLLGTVAVIALAFGPARAEQMLPYKSDWRTIEAANGSVYKIDQKSITHMNNGSAEIIVYAVEGNDYNPTNVKRLLFDCHGHYQDLTSGGMTTLYAPPRSIAGQLSAIACAGARDARFDEPLKNAPLPEPQWTDYCKGFSEDACARIRKVVEAKVTPSYCKPGFAVVPTSLSNEQLRICYVMPPLKTAAAPAPSQRAAAAPPASQPAPSQPARSDIARPNERLQSALNDLKPLRSEDGVNDADWLRIEGPDGEVSAIIDPRTIQHDPDGNAHARTCLIKDGACARGFRQTWFYNCHDQTYSWIDTSVLPGLPREMNNAEPTSVAGKLLAVACR
jgi:hypothetical protein